MEYHIRIVPGGRVTRLIEERLEVGQSVKVSGPLGSSYLRREHTGPMLCVAGGTGLAPMLSVARGALEAGMTNSILLFFGVKSERDIYGEDRLAALARRFPNFRYEIVVSAGANGRGGYRRGLVTEAVAEDLPRLEGWRTYLAGPPVMVEAGSVLAVQRGAPAEHIHADAFYATGI
jgi:ferredoxin-NAD(P)+ reductase (naphthalene dioxygenase ferredoxin-specific)